MSKSVRANAAAPYGSAQSLKHEQEELERRLAHWFGAAAPSEADGVWKSHWPPYLGYALDFATNPRTNVEIIVLRKECYASDSDPELCRAAIEWQALREEVRAHAHGLSEFLFLGRGRGRGGQQH